MQIQLSSDYPEREPSCNAVSSTNIRMSQSDQYWVHSNPHLKCLFLTLVASTDCMMKNVRFARSLTSSLRMFLVIQFHNLTKGDFRTSFSYSCLPHTPSSQSR